MSSLVNVMSVQPQPPLPPCFALTLTRDEIVVIIDALLQAEMTLPLLDARHEALHPVKELRALQLSLAERLEDLIAETPPTAPPEP